MPVWRNWQTRATQNREGNRGGSSPSTGTIRKGNAFFSIEESIFAFITILLLTAQVILVRK